MIERKSNLLPILHSLLNGGNFWTQFQCILYTMNLRQILWNSFLFKRKRSPATTPSLDFFRHEEIFSFCSSDLRSIKHLGKFRFYPTTDAIMLIGRNSCIFLNSRTNRNFWSSTTRLENIDIHIGHSLTQKFCTGDFIQSYKHKWY